MKKPLLFILLSVFCKTAISQADTATMKPLTDSICNCLSKKDLSKISNKVEANAVFTDCFTKHAAAMIDLAQKEKVDIADESAMHNLGIEIGKELFRRQCEAFVQISLKMAEKDNGNAEAGATNGSTNGKLKRIENKDFRYLFMEDANKREYSFIWLHYFAGSEKFIENTDKYIGKKMKVKWKETEVFLPQGKGYFKIKEITGIDIEE